MATSFKLKVKDYNEDGRIVTIQEKEIYNLDGVKTAADWVREPVKGIKTFDAPQLYNALKFKDEGKGKIAPNSLGYFYTHGNNVRYNTSNVCLFSAPFSMAQGVSILPQNFNNVISLFAARKLIEQSWLNDKDEYMVPNESHPNYQQFVNDSVVFSLFHSASNQSSLRKIQYKNKEWDIINHFFFMSVREMQELAVQHNFNDLYNDTIGKQDSYVYNLLNTINLSDDAKNVLEMARNLVHKSFPLRQAAHQVTPEFHLNAFDSGWYQIRNGILKSNFKDDYKAFTDAYKELASRLKPLVYELGFLKA